MKQVLIRNLDTESHVAMVWLVWHLEGEAKVLYSIFRKNPAYKHLIVTRLLTELRQFSIPFINKINSGPHCRLCNKPIMAELGLCNKWLMRVSKCRSSYLRLGIGSATTNCLKLLIHDCELQSGPSFMIAWSGSS